ncbi:recombinase family protein [Allokutzneria sp. A3M-2-11 16]|uniref:recombinase family protein n=1 Tax=Allokutzneria sp. A3M-2-11 16 TaxID=2962043 RepID=UPI0020B724E2|nr:recombinase family protein [Allokutzneria sp. A3M-2-11 16]MCP3803891.1 recombinase family protein [Allokutzneria sp. A3M-2-11 16]
MAKRAPKRSAKRALKRVRAEKRPEIPFTPDNDAALIYARESYTQDGSTAEEVQFEKGTRWANAFDIPIVDTISDLSVSGALSAFERPELGPWLGENPPAHWKTLIVTKLDRVGRDTEDILALFRWARENGKRIVFVSEGIDTSMELAKLIITVLAAIAEMERGRIAERIADAKAKHRENGRWTGDRYVYGLMPVRRENGEGLEIAVDPVAVEVLRELSAKARSGARQADLMRWLNDREIPTPMERTRQHKAERENLPMPSLGATWALPSVRDILTNTHLVEWGIYSEAEHKEIKANILRPELQARGARRIMPFSGLFVCPECAGPLWLKQRTNKYTKKDGTVQVYASKAWHCPKKHITCADVDGLEALAMAEFTRAFSAVIVRERRVVPPTDHANDIARLERRYAETMASVVKAQPDERAVIIAKAEAMMADVDRLRALPIDPGGLRWVDTDTVWSDKVRGLDPMVRRDVFLSFGVRFVVMAADRVVPVIEVPTGARDRDVPNINTRGGAVIEISTETGARFVGVAPGVTVTPDSESLPEHVEMFEETPEVWRDVARRTNPI